MGNTRRDFIKQTTMAGIGFSAAGLPIHEFSFSDKSQESMFSDITADEKDLSMIGLYGPWAVNRLEKQLPAISFRRKEWTSVDKWRETARKRVLERMAIPDIGGMPEVKVNKQYTYDGLHIEELSWQLPYGRPTQAILLKPAQAKGPLPGILAFHDHSGDKYFGTQKIVRTADTQHPMMDSLQQRVYSGRAWANEIAKLGYVVLVPDAFSFGSRRVMLQDVPAAIRKGVTDPDSENAKGIEAYNQWASEHEHIMAKSLFCAGTTWPAVFFAEDQKALDILSARKDVDASRIGCGGLSGGGLRSVLMGGLDARIKCAVSVGFMTTWKDLALNKSHTHTWMIYVPLLPNELDFPEIMALRAPLPTLVLNDSDDPLFTLPQMKQADQILAEIYKKANATDKYKCSFYPGPHKFDADMQKEAFAWFDQWLKS